mgnify:CR=1 FL=1
MRIKRKKNNVFISEAGKSRTPIRLLYLLALPLLLCIPAFADEIDDVIPYLIIVESQNNPAAVSNAGCIGLMQINPRGALKEWNETHPTMRLTPKDLFDPIVNVTVGRWYLHRLKNYYLKNHYTLERLLAAYNGGITRLKRCGYNISCMPQETQAYVQKIMRLYRRGAR